MRRSASARARSPASIRVEHRGDRVAGDARLPGVDDVHAMLELRPQFRATAECARRRRVSRKVSAERATVRGRVVILPAAGDARDPRFRFVGSARRCRRGFHRFAAPRGESAPAPPRLRRRRSAESGTDGKVVLSDRRASPLHDARAARAARIERLASRRSPRRARARRRESRARSRTARSRGCRRSRPLVGVGRHVGPSAAEIDSRRRARDDSRHGRSTWRHCAVPALYAV